MRTTVVGTVILLAWLAWPPAASAQTNAPNQTDRWAPWIGCWSLITEDLREGAGTSLASALVPGKNGTPAPVDSQRAQICVARSGNGVTMTTTVPDQPATTQTLVADGSPHEFVDGDCRGTERTEWSKAGSRLIARADVKCADKAPRVLTGLGLITRDGYWLDIRSLRIDGEDATRVSRFRRVSGTRISGQPLSIDEIKEVSAIVSSTVVEAAVAETRPQFDMSKRMLRELAAAKVPSNVIDVMVATSYPDKFVVEKQPRRYFGAPMNSAFFAPTFTGLSPCLSSSLYVGFDQDYCGAYGYQYYSQQFLPGYYNRTYYDATCCITTGGGGGGAVVAPGTPVGPARAINGQGYTRIHPIEQSSGPTTRTSNGNGTQSVNSGGSSGGSTGSVSSGGSSSSDSGSSSGSSSGGSASPSGFSGGGGDGGGRTAVPR